MDRPEAITNNSHLPNSIGCEFQEQSKMAKYFDPTPEGKVTSERTMHSDTVITVFASSEEDNISALVQNQGNENSDVQTRQTAYEAAAQFHPRSLHDLTKGPQQRPRWYKTFVMAYQTMGVVYGGLATSPLYVYSSINITAPSEDDYLAVFSIIFWTLSFIGFFKYVLIVLQADYHGEGGTFALYSLICQQTNIGHCEHRPSLSKPMVERSKIVKYGSVQSKLMYILGASKTSQKLLLALTMTGTCMLIGDGILTPAISVVSAVDGLRDATPAISQTIVVIISTVLLLILFLLQRFGTQHVSFVFSPIMVVWLISTPLIGAYNILIYYPKIFTAISPHHIVDFFLRHGKEGWKTLGGTALCITGAEAMFADLGHFAKRPMQVAFTFGVYPSNLITYAGQTAYLIKHPKNQSKTFYSFVPNALFWPMVLVSTLAAVVASQGVISACFSLIKQSMNHDYFPRVRLIHTSEAHEGQIYSPEVNYFLLGVCIAVVIGFGDGAALGNAYGVSVIMVMCLTTILLTLVMLVVWGTAPALALTFLAFFLAIEGCYVSAVLTKVRDGGWLPFLVASFLAVIMFSWVYGRQKKHEFEIANRASVGSLTALVANLNTKRVPGICLIYSSLENEIPPVVVHYIRKIRSLHRVIVLTKLRRVRDPVVPRDERFLFWQSGYKGVYHCVGQYGYAESMDDESKKFSEILLADLEDFVLTLATQVAIAKGWAPAQVKEEERPISEFPMSVDDLAEEIAEIRQARSEGPVLIVGRTRLATRSGGGWWRWWRALVIDKIYGFLEVNSVSSLWFLRIPAANLVEVGMVYEV